MSILLACFYLLWILQIMSAKFGLKHCVVKHKDNKLAHWKTVGRIDFNNAEVLFPQVQRSTFIFDHRFDWNWILLYQTCFVKQREEDLPYCHPIASMCLCIKCLTILICVCLFNLDYFKRPQSPPLDFVVQILYLIKTPT